ncbi:MAG TPA: ECF-type sigma factor [Planctomycetota bacterium]|nr:ECF-type sigma factor [Planctomycetota bacterium]
MDAQHTTLLLRRMAEGDAQAAAELLPLVWGDLHDLASAYMGAERVQHTLQPTALIHEAWLRVAGPGAADWNDRAHFMGIAARAMRRVLIDHARRRSADKRPSAAARVPLDGVLEVLEERGPDLLVLNEALERLDSVDGQLARIVEMRFFAGSSNAEVAAALGVSERTVERGWKTAQAWLRNAIGSSAEDSS